MFRMESQEGNVEGREGDGEEGGLREIGAGLLEGIKEREEGETKEPEHFPEPPGRRLWQPRWTKRRW